VRFFIAMFSHETNTFSTLPSDRRQFEARDLRYGGELLEAYRGTGTCLGGMIDVAEARGVTLVPSLAAAAAPAGRVAATFYAETTRRLLADLAAAGRLDGVLLDLHGAMVPEGLEDGEGELLRAVRATVGPAVPVAVTLDFHANVTEDMVRHATLLHGYKTYPHVDMDARGREATERLLDVAAGRIRPRPPGGSPRCSRPSRASSPRADRCGGSTTWRTSSRATRAWSRSRSSRASRSPTSVTRGSRATS